MVFLVMSAGRKSSRGKKSLAPLQVGRRKREAGVVALPGTAGNSRKKIARKPATISPATTFNSRGVSIAADLTDRENQIAQRLVRGKSYKHIAEDLYIALETVRAHVKKIYRKLGVCSRGELAWKLLNDKV